MATVKRLLVNPRRKKTAAKRKSFSAKAPAKRTRRKNPGALIGLGNPRKGQTMKKKHVRKNAAPTARRRKNPARVRQIKAKLHRRRRNPSTLIGSGMSSLKMGLLALIGLVVTRQTPQMLLGAKNTGWYGYLANFATMLASSAAASKMIGKPAGQSVAIGGGLYIVNRLLSEQFSPIGKALSLSGLGDAQAATPGQLAGIKPAYFPTPVSYDANGQPVVPQLIEDRIRAAIPATPSSKMAGYRMAS